MLKINLINAMYVETKLGRVAVVICETDSVMRDGRKLGDQAIDIKVVQNVIDLI
jgi:hypothetical protein